MGVTSLADKVGALLPAHATCIVDVANLTPSQQSHLPCGAVLLSTHKTFNYMQRTETLPTCHRMWIVLRVPTATKEKDDGHAATMPHFDTRLKRFASYERLRSSPHVRYHKRSPKGKSICSIVVSPTQRTSHSHSACELDDMVLASLSVKQRLPLLTNDRALAQQTRQRDLIRASHSMNQLADATRVTVLTRVGQSWREKRGARRRQRSPTCTKSP